MLTLTLAQYSARAWSWFRKGGWLVLVAIGLVVMVCSRRRSLSAALSAYVREITQVRAEAAAERIVVEKGHDEAIRTIHAQYAAKLEELHRVDAAKATELQNDPVQLARVLAGLPTATK